MKLKPAYSRTAEINHQSGAPLLSEDGASIDHGRFLNRIFLDSIIGDLAIPLGGNS